jgi:short-subunit dehydrogenase
MVARNEDRLQGLENELAGSKSYICDLSDLEALATMMNAVKKDLGAPEVLVHNAASSTFKSFMDADPEDLERNFRVNTTALLYLARSFAPAMVDAGRGAILITGNTAAYRGTPNAAVFAPTKAAQRILAESLARDLWPKGVHVAYVAIDALIDTPRTRPFAAPDKPDDYFAKPTAIAEEVFHLVHQDRSAWAFDIMIRPFGEKW